MIQLARNIKRCFSLKEAIVILIAISLSITAGIGVYKLLKKEVIINDNGKVIAVNTMKSTVAEVLEQTGVKVADYDYISLPVQSKLGFKTKINIKRAIPVTVYADGQEYRIMTYRDTVKEALAQAEVPFDADDKLANAKLEDKITVDMSIKVIRVKEVLDKKREPIPFKVVSRENSHMDKGDTRVARDGKEGIREKVYKVVFEDGIEVARELLKDFVASDPVDKLVEYGTVLNFKTSRGEVVRYRKVITMKATAYTASYADTGKGPGDPGFGITYTGMRVKKGVIAVDPRVIPLGTRVYVQVAGDTPDYGFAVAADIGGAIKGNLIDLYFDSQKTVDYWGCKRVKVYVLVD